MYFLRKYFETNVNWKIISKIVLKWDSGNTENGSLYCNTNYLNPSVREKINFYIKIVKDGHTKIK